jgi:uncharacterized protein
LIPLKLPSGKVLQAEVMDTPELRGLGVMFRPSLPEDRGLLFTFERLDFYSFWMKNCRFPIDMVWLDEHRRVVHLAEAVPPCRKDPCPSYQPMQRAQYVVELNAHQARREKVVLGAVLDFTLPR